LQESLQDSFRRQANTLAIIEPRLYSKQVTKPLHVAP
jgi:hypothetical protein